MLSAAVAANALESPTRDPHLPWMAQTASVSGTAVTNDMCSSWAGEVDPTWATVTTVPGCDQYLHTGDALA
jgi:hypothetical protein